MADKKRLTFKNNSMVRNLYLKGNVPVNYTVPTKRNNGKSKTSNSRVQENYKRKPKSYKWNSSLSFENTYPSSTNAQRLAYNRNSKKMQEKYGSFWVDAVVCGAIVDDKIHEIMQAFDANITKLIEQKIGQAPKTIFLKHLNKMIKLELDLKKQLIDKATFTTESERIFDEMADETQINRSILTTTYPYFKTAGLEQARILEFIKEEKKKALSTLFKLKQSANAQKKKAEKNTRAKWHTLQNTNENRAPGAELLALAAKYANNPKNFAAVYNGVTRKNGKYVVGTGSEIQDALE